MSRAKIDIACQGVGKRFALIDSGAIVAGYFFFRPDPLNDSFNYY